ncbi:MAG: hypothetical protein EOP61_22780 [Sphingomonadales bacterium]|nr:MAG: hypothetical protein EOP61_22780 [Sphingomonadales bacterium]
MQFMMFVCSDAEPDPKPEAEGEIHTWLADAGDKRLIGDRLRPPADAKTVRMRGGRRMVTDGPFAETKETILGFDILDCASMDEAIEIAAKHPMARAGRIELRPFWPID